MGYRLGIDLGTTYTAAAIARDGRAEMATLGDRGAAVPSVLFLRPDGEYLVGDAAVRRGLTEPDRLAREFKRRLGDPAPLLLGGSPVPADALMGSLLGWVVDHVTEREGQRPDHVTVTHPANWGPYKRELLDQAITRAGVRDIASTITEPEAAAISYASMERLDPGEVVAVYVLGGGTFDAAVLRKTADGFELLGSPEGLERTGGIDFDEAVFGHVAGVIGDTLAEIDLDEPRALAALARLREDCVGAKEALSSDTDVAIPVLLPTVQTEVRLTRGEFEAMIRPTLVDTVNALERAVRGAGVEVSDLRAVLLVGGSSRIPLVGELVSRQIGRPVAVDVHPKHAVALGAALQGADGDTAAPAQSSAAAPVASAPTATAAAPAAAPPPPPPDPPAAPPAPPASVSTPGDGGGSQSSRVRLLAAGVVALLVVAVIAGVLLTRKGGDDSSSDTAGDTTETSETLPERVPVAKTTASDGTKQFALDTFAVSSTVYDVVVTGGSGWALGRDDARLIRIDPASDQISAIVNVGNDARSLAFGAGSLWTGNGSDSTVSRVDPAANKRTATIQMNGTPVGIAASDTAVWVSRDDGNVLRINTANNEVTDTIAVGGSGGGVALGAGTVWAANAGNRGVVVIEEASGRVLNVIPTGPSPSAITFGADAVWVIDDEANTVSRIDPAKRVVSDTIQLGEQGRDLIVAGKDLWVTLPSGNAVARIDIATKKVVGKVPVGPAPAGIGEGEGSVWVCITEENKITRISG